MPLPFVLALARALTGLRGLVALLALACAFAGCANFSGIASGDSAQSVEDKIGKPVTVWKNNDGSELWQYPLGYYAVQCYMVTIGPDQRVREIHQARGEPYFSMVVAGMSRDDVFRLLGRPREVWTFAGRDEETWTWRYWDSNYMFFNVMFDQTAGTVRSTQRIQEILFLEGGRGKH